VIDNLKYPSINIALPDWVEPFLAGKTGPIKDLEERMRLVVALSRENVRHDLGGPFAAAVFDDAGNLVAPGVNRVTAMNCSVLHAEIVAIALAQQAVGRFDLSDGGRRHFDLVTATEPCAMCFGAVCWSGIRRLVCGARDEDARAVGFDEGPKLENWIAALNERGILVVRDVCREEAVKVHRDYVAAGGPIYNSGQAFREGMQEPE